MPSSSPFIIVASKPTPAPTPFVPRSSPSGRITITNITMLPQVASQQQQASLPSSVSSSSSSPEPMTDDPDVDLSLLLLPPPPTTASPLPPVATAAFGFSHSTLTMNDVVMKPARHAAVPTSLHCSKKV